MTSGALAAWVGALEGALSQVEECMWAALERSEDAGEDALIPAGEILSILVNLEASDAE